MKNYYNILGLPETASLEQINDAYKKLALKFHPDKNDNDPYFLSFFQEINAAKQVLTNPEEKAEYDLQLTNYADSYEFFKQQVYQEKMLRKERFEHIRIAETKKRSVWVVGLLAMLFLVIFFIFAKEEENRSANTRGLGAAGFEEIAPDKKPSTEEPELATKTAVVPEQKLEIEAPAEKQPQAEKNQAQIVINETPSQSNLFAGDEFSENEMEEILRAIQTEQQKLGSNATCIKVRRTKTSNVDAGYRIANYLQKKGFTISGREVTSDNADGINIDASGPCINLTIGKSNSLTANF